MSKIEWTDETWNPVTGCTEVGTECAHCYAKIMHKRLRAMGQEKYSEPFHTVRIHPQTLDLPSKWRKPRMVFVNSMADLFHNDVPKEFIAKVFDAMSLSPQHTFQVLTKRSKRLRILTRYSHPWPKNIWMGVSCGIAKQKTRIDDLRATGAAVKFLSLEPLLEDLGNINLSGIDWVIVGGESGPGSRPMDGDWARRIRNQCIQAGVKFFFKQWGGVNKKKAGRVLDGRTWDELPRWREKTMFHVKRSLTLKKL